MPTPEEFIREARSWVRTPFRPNQSCKHVGADCIGFIAGAAANVGITLRDVRRAYPLWADGTLEPWMDEHLVKVYDDPEPGDIFLMRWQRQWKPHHLAVYAGATIIQSYAGVLRVVEQPMHADWWEKLVWPYRFREFV